jgi:integrase
MKSHDIRIWNVSEKTPVRVGRDGKKKPATYQLRWRVGGKVHPKTFVGRTPADNFRSRLLVAMHNGEAFDTETGLPDSMIEAPEQSTWYDFAADYMDMKWKHLSAKGRETTVYAAASVIASLVAAKAGAPTMPTLRRALQSWYLEPSKRVPRTELDEEGDIFDDTAAAPEEMDHGPSDVQNPKPPPHIAKALAWLAKNSLPIAAIAEPKHARAVLDALATKIDGTVAAPDYIRRRRGVVSNMVRYAIERGELATDPFKAIQWTPPKVAKQIDRRRVPNPRQVRDLLIGVTYVGTWKRAGGRRYVAFFGCLYYALMRPEEVIGLHEDDCELPDEGWGLLILHKATPYAGRRWTDGGELHDDKALKARAVGETRSVPIPPVLVRMLRDHIAEFGSAQDGRIFRTEKGKAVTPFAYQRVWKQARAFALPPGRASSALADIPYDLRHAGISLGLRTTRDPALVAERAGQSVETLMKRYAWALDDKDSIANKAIEDALNGADE